MWRRLRLLHGPNEFEFLAKYVYKLHANLNSVIRTSPHRLSPGASGSTSRTLKSSATPAIARSATMSSATAVHDQVVSTVMSAGRALSRRFAPQMRAVSAWRSTRLASTGPSPSALSERTCSRGPALGPGMVEDLVMFISPDVDKF